ncbi:protein NYNRIN-like [Grus japonensis]|uniref:Protein NYNRIN-like n=1 Tax=Grus japonensis TaxID=30415 RepID=A0ABC9XMI9_GRUJA
MLAVECTHMDPTGPLGICLYHYPTKVREDLEEDELDDGEKLFVDGSSRVVEGQRKSGYAIVDGCTFQIKESGPLSKAWSAQACPLHFTGIPDFTEEGTLVFFSSFPVSYAHSSRKDRR